VALSHTLTEEQLTDLNANKIVLLADVNADLAAQCRQIDPTFSTTKIKFLAAQVVAEAINVDATHFFCQGEPCLAMWSNMIASGSFNYDLRSTPSTSHNSSDFGNFFIKSLNGKTIWSKKMTCIQSTNKALKHVQWRELF